MCFYNPRAMGEGSMELFDVHFTEGGWDFVYHLSPAQAENLYSEIGIYLSTTDRAPNFDVTFREKGTAVVYHLDAREIFTIYRELGTYLERRYRASAPHLRVHEVAS